MIRQSFFIRYLRDPSGGSEDGINGFFDADTDSVNITRKTRRSLLRKTRKSFWYRFCNWLRRRMLLKILSLSFAALFLFIAAVFIINVSSVQRAGDIVQVTVPSGASGAKIADILAQNSVIGDKRGFIDLLVAQKVSLRAGVYRLKRGMSPREALSAMLNPENRTSNTVVIIEGATLTGIFSALSKKTDIPIVEFEKVASDLSNFPDLPRQASSVEGFLFPATYDIEEGATAKSLLLAMYKRMWAEIRTLGIPSENVWRTVVLAALIQKEGIPSDFARVSRVFVNRLERGMNLQSDATVLYGLKLSGQVVTTDEQREDKGNPYNTYVHAGLPPGAISNPGAAALKAAIYPAPGKWLFFVTWNECTGETIFSETFSEHQKGVDKWLRWRKNHPDGKC